MISEQDFSDYLDVVKHELVTKVQKAWEPTEHEKLLIKKYDLIKDILNYPPKIVNKVNQKLAWYYKVDNDKKEGYNWEILFFKCTLFELETTRNKLHENYFNSRSRNRNNVQTNPFYL